MGFEGRQKVRENEKTETRKTVTSTWAEPRCGGFTSRVRKNTERKREREEEEIETKLFCRIKTGGKKRCKRMLVKCLPTWRQMGNVSRSFAA